MGKVLFKLHDDSNFQVFESSNLPFFLTLCPDDAFEYSRLLALLVFTLRGGDCIEVKRIEIKCHSLLEKILSFLK